MGYQVFLLICCRLRDLSIVLLFLPLWLVTAIYRAVPSIKIPWVEENWTLLSVLVFTLGVFALWRYLESVVQAHAQHRPVRILTGSIWLLALALFGMAVGAILASNDLRWGEALLLGGTVGIPLFVLWLLMFESYQQRERRVNRVAETQSETTAP